MIAKELTEKCGLDLAVDFSTDQCLYDDERSDNETNRSVEGIVYVGDSHGVRTVKFFDINVFDTRDICVGGWTLSEGAVETKVKDLVAEGDKAPHYGCVPPV